MPFADQDLARRVEEAWSCLSVLNAQAHARLDPASAATSLPVGGGHAVFMGAGSPLSQAQGLGFYGPVSDADLERMEVFYRDRGARVQVEVSSLAEPSLLALLSRRGYRAIEQTHVLVRPIEPGGIASEGPPPRGRDRSDRATADDEIAVAPIRVDEVGTWAESVLRCFFEGSEPIPPGLLEGAVAMASLPGVSCWLARAGGRIAGGGALVIHNALTLIAGDGTLPEFRNRGVQTALLRARLDWAHRAGCDLAVVCTQPGSGSQHNAQRQGFQMVYARTLMSRE